MIANPDLGRSRAKEIAGRYLWDVGDEDKGKGAVVMEMLRDPETFVAQF